MGPDAPPPGCHTYPITFSSTFLGFYESSQTPWPITEHKPQQQRAESQFPSALLQGAASLAEGKGKEDKSSQTAQLAGSGQVAGPRTGFLLTERGAGGPEMHSSARPGKRRKPGRGVPHSPMLRLRLVEHPAGMNPDPGAALPVLSLRGLVHLG